MRLTSINIIFLIIFHCFAGKSQNMETNNYKPIFCGEDYTNIFEIANNTSVKILITKVRPICSCIEILEYSSEIPAWSTGKVTSILKTSKLSGNVDYKIMVQTDQKENPVIELELKANVIRDLVIQPSQTDIGKMISGTIPSPIKIQIYSSAGQELSEPVFSNLPLWLETEITKNEEKWEINFKFIKAPPIGNINVWLQINASKKAERPYFFRIKGRVEPIFSIKPSLLIFRSIKPGTKQQRKIKIKSIDNRPIQIKKIEIENEMLKVINLNTNSKTEVEATLELSPKKKGQFNFHLTFELNDTNQPTARLRIIGGAESN